MEEDNIEVDEIEGVEDVEDEAHVSEIVNEWQMSIPFIKRGMQHPCGQFSNNQDMPYADEPYYRKPTRLDMEFQAGQQFVSKTELKNKLAAFHIEHNMQSEVVNNNKNMLIVKCKNKNCL